MTDIQALPADHRFALTGKLVISPRYGVHTWPSLGQEDAIDLYRDLLNLFEEDSVPGDRVVLQYTPGPDGKEAGSRFFDSPDSPEHAEFSADSTIAYLIEIEAGFAAGKEFVA